MWSLPEMEKRESSWRRGYGSYIETGVGMAAFWGGGMMGVVPSRRDKREARGVRYQFLCEGIGVPPWKYVQKARGGRRRVLWRRLYGPLLDL